jgi:hypothetical protein
MGALYVRILEQSKVKGIDLFGIGVEDERVP